MVKKQKIPLSEADAVLTELDNLLKEKEQVSMIELSLFEDEKLIFRDELELGNDAFQSLILFITDTLDNIFDDIPVQDKNDFLNQLIFELNGGDEEEETTLDIDKPLYQNEPLKGMNKKVQHEKEKKTPLRFFRNKRINTIILLCVVVLILGVIAYFSFFTDGMSFSGKIQQAFNNADYATVVQSEGKSKSDLLLKAKAYIKLSKVNEAEKVNKELKNQELAYLINEFYTRETYRFIQEKNLTAADELVAKVDDKSLTKDVERAKEILSLLGAIDTHLKDTNLDTINRLKDHLNKEYDLIQFNAY